MDVGCAVLHSDTDIDDAQAQAKAGEASLLNALAAIACLMIFSSLLGLLGLRLGGNCAKILLKVYLVLLVLTSVICVCFYTVRAPPENQRASASSGSQSCSALAVQLCRSVLPSTAQARFLIALSGTLNVWLVGGSTRRTQRRGWTRSWRRTGTLAGSRLRRAAR